MLHMLLQRFGKFEYLVVGLAAALPCCILPIFIVGKVSAQMLVHVVSHYFSVSKAMLRCSLRKFGR